ncbi:hypothetical protein PC116_g22041 [Phytophthora cactorum]|nr:hypothetical protein PC114_g18795 [Phytophthora cactorum]KAG3162500.1 hypothetical protein PC128_g20582 [Phytophthora cactorum]KAG4229646.1 hypothetical protein PC116_g22041 [Phytophthora cactorum]
MVEESTEWIRNVDVNEAKIGSPVETDGVCSCVTKDDEVVSARHYE